MPRPEKGSKVKLNRLAEGFRVPATHDLLRIHEIPPDQMHSGTNFFGINYYYR